MNTVAPFEGPLPEGWSGGAPITKFWRGNYVHLYRVTRPCKSCGAAITIDVSRKALEGSATNTGLLLRNCPKCREVHKAGGIGSRGGHSRPTAGETPDLVTKVAEQDMEIRSLYERNRELTERLAKYELGPAIQAAQEKLPWD